MIFVVREDGSSLRLSGTVWFPESVVDHVEATEWGKYIHTKGGKVYWVPGDAARQMIEDADEELDRLGEYETDLRSRHSTYMKGIEDDTPDTTV